MLITLRIYNIFCWNSSPIKKPCGTIRCCNIVAGRPKPLMLKAKAQTIFINFKIKKMKTTKMSLANIQGKFSRTEMKSILAGGSGGGSCATECTVAGGAVYACYHDTTGSTCYCPGGNSSIACS